MARTIRDNINNSKLNIEVMNKSIYKETRLVPPR